MKNYIDIPKRFISTTFNDVDIITGKDMITECIKNVINLNENEVKMMNLGVSVNSYLLNINSYVNMLDLSKKIENEVKKIELVKDIIITSNFKEKKINIAIKYKIPDGTGLQSVEYNLRELV